MISMGVQREVPQYMAHPMLMTCVKALTTSGKNEYHNAQTFLFVYVSVFECVHAWVYMSEILDAFQENQVKSLSFYSDFIIYKNLHLEYTS